MIALPQPLDREEWADIPGHPGYQVSSQGRVRSYWLSGRKPRVTEVARIAKNSPHSAGYRVVSMKSTTPFYVHHLVLLAFAGPRPADKPHTRHLNGDRADNRIDNLAYGTPKENSDDIDRHGTRIRGEEASWSRYTDAQVLEVVRLHRDGAQAGEIEAATGVNAAMVSVIMQGKTRSHVTGIKEPEGRGIYKITAEDARSIIQMVNAGMGHKEIAGLHGCCKSNVSMIATGQCWVKETADIRRPHKARPRRQLQPS